MKESRQKQIIDIITSRDVETQNDLIDELLKAGVRCTQATVSRDIKELRLVKELTSRGTYRYAAPSVSRDEHNEKLRTIFRECVTSYVRAQNMVVLKTLPGLASAACSAIDRMDIEELAGTLAGDDTCFICMLNNEAAERLCQEIGAVL